MIKFDYYNFGTNNQTQKEIKKNIKLTFVSVL
jgi:hypothetical protein